MKWEDLTQRTRDVMRELGNFGPTVRAENREVKGAMYDPDSDGVGKVYFSSADLRGIASACSEVADWLDKRADLPAPPQEPTK